MVEPWVVTVVSPIVNAPEVVGKVDCVGVPILDLVVEVVACEGCTEASVPVVVGPDGGDEGCVLGKLLDQH